MCCEDAADQMQIGGPITAREICGSFANWRFAAIFAA
jgi:hypothetical protein